MGHGPNLLFHLGLGTSDMAIEILLKNYHGPTGTNLFFIVLVTVFLCNIEKFTMHGK